MAPFGLKSIAIYGPKSTNILVLMIIFWFYEYFRWLWKIRSVFIIRKPTREQNSYNLMGSFYAPFDNAPWRVGSADTKYGTPLENTAPAFWNFFDCLSVDFMLKSHFLITFWTRVLFHSLPSFLSQLLVKKWLQLTTEINRGKKTISDHIVLLKGNKWIRAEKGIQSQAF